MDATGLSGIDNLIRYLLRLAFVVDATGLSGIDNNFKYGVM